MFGCGIGGLGKKFGFRRQRTNDKRIDNFEQLYSERIDYASSYGSDLHHPDDEQIQWTPNPPLNPAIKRGFAIQDEPAPITVNPNDIYFGNTLGKGASGTVYRGRLGCEEVAIKILRRQESDFDLGAEPLELYMGQRVSHRNLVKVLGVYVGNDPIAEESENIPEEDISIYDSPPGLRRTSSSLFSDIAQDLSDGPEEIWIVMEYCNKGSLREAIKAGEFFEDSDRQRPRILHILFAALEVADALEHLHSFGIIHGDLKSQNVMLTSSQILAKNFVCKVGDFGMSRPLTQIKTHISTFTAGTVSHMPPEVLRDGILTTALDVFSFGMLLWELMAGQLPFLGLNSGETLVSIVEGQRPEIPEYCPTMYAELIRRCWHPHRDERPTFKDINRILKTMLGGPSLAANKGIPAMTNPSSVPTSSGDLLLTEGDTVTTTEVNTMTTDLSDPGCLSSNQNRSTCRTKNDKCGTEMQQTPRRVQATSEHHLETATAESLIPRPPRIEVSNQSTDASQVSSKISARRKRAVSFPQWQAYLDAISVSNNSSFPPLAPSKTRIPSCSTPPGASHIPKR